MMAINGLISFSDIWESYKHDKKDCLVMVITLVITFVFQTSIGLAIGEKGENRRREYCVVWYRRVKKDRLYLRRGWEKIDKYLRTYHWFLYVLYDNPSNENQFVP